MLILVRVHSGGAHGGVEVDLRARQASGQVLEGKRCSQRLLRTKFRVHLFSELAVGRREVLGKGLCDVTVGSDELFDSGTITQRRKGWVECLVAGGQVAGLGEQLTEVVIDVGPEIMVNMALLLDMGFFLVAVSFFFFFLNKKENGYSDG